MLLRVVQNGYRAWLVTQREEYIYYTYGWCFHESARNNIWNQERGCNKGMEKFYSDEIRNLCTLSDITRSLCSSVTIASDY